MRVHDHNNASDADKTQHSTNTTTVWRVSWRLRHHRIVRVEWKISTCTLLLSKRLIYYFWPENINQSHCSGRNNCVSVFCIRWQLTLERKRERECESVPNAQTDGHCDGVPVAEHIRPAIRSVDNEKQVEKKNFYNLDILCVANADNDVCSISLRLLALCGRLLLPIVCMRWCGISLISERTTRKWGIILIIVIWVTCNGSFSCFEHSRREHATAGGACRTQHKCVGWVARRR